MVAENPDPKRPPQDSEPAAAYPAAEASELSAAPSLPRGLQAQADDFLLAIVNLCAAAMPLPVVLTCGAVCLTAHSPLPAALASAVYVGGHFGLHRWTCAAWQRPRLVDWILGPFRTIWVCAFTIAIVAFSGAHGGGWVTALPLLFVMGFVARKHVWLSSLLIIGVSVGSTWWVEGPPEILLHATVGLTSAMLLSGPLVGRFRELWTHAMEASQALQAANRELLAQKGQLEILLREAKQASLAKDRFLANMSHEMRTPLNGIIGVISLLRSSDLKGEQRELVEIARQSANDLLAEVSDVLDLTKLESGRMQIEAEPFDLRDELTRLVSEFRFHETAADKHLEFTMRGALPRTVVGDRTRIRQVVRNLLSNAFKFTASKGHVELRLEAQPGERTDRLRARICVEDDGIGIPQDAQRRIFDRFEQVDASTTRKYGGTGLGLAISSQLVRAMGGTIGVESELGEGSTFWIELELPCSGMAAASAAATGPAATGAAAEEAVPVRAGGLGGRKVLLVEDLRINQIVGSRLLQKLGCEVELASNGREALEVLDRRHFDVVLMDCQMPELDGYDATRALRVTEKRLGGRRTPVIALTAAVSPADRDRCLAAGMDAFVPKPIREEDLERTLLEALRRK